MRTRALLLPLLLVSASAWAQSPQAVPLRENTPSRDTTVSRPDPRRTARDTTDSVRHDPNARHRTDGRVSPPAAINSPVQVIAPEKR
jgi:hypothetical protein